jgi:hypothetical protein
MPRFADAVFIPVMPINKHNKTAKHIGPIFLIFTPSFLLEKGYKNFVFIPVLPSINTTPLRKILAPFSHFYTSFPVEKEVPHGANKYHSISHRLSPEKIPFSSKIYVLKRGWGGGEKIGKNAL